MRVREVDIPAKLWTVPAERMKTEDDPEGTRFEVPLSAPAIAILKAVIPKDAAADAYVFAGQWSTDNTKPLGQNAVLHALKAVYPAMTAHDVGRASAIGLAMKHTSSAISPKWHWLTR
jgi:integrase